jgi:hypothetical protein
MKNKGGGMKAGRIFIVGLSWVVVMGWGMGAMAQAPDTLWTRMYPMNGGEFFGFDHFSVCQAVDGGFAVAGCSSGVFSNLDILLMKVDSLGEYQWGHHYAQGASAYIVVHEARSVRRTIDGGFVITGLRCVQLSPYSEILCYSFMVKTDTFGGLQWQRTSSAGQMSYYGEQTPDGGYICVGGDSYHYGFLVSKKDSQGINEWFRDYGGSGSEDAYSAQGTDDGGNIIVGYTNSFGAGANDLFLVKTDSLGDTLWTRTYGGIGSDIANCVRQASDGGFALCGGTTSFGAGGSDVYLIRTNSLGDTLWTRTYGGSSNDEALSMQITDDGGYILAGHTRSYGAGSYDVYVIKTNALGDTEWTATYGGPGSEGAYSVQQTSDGGYIIAGGCGDGDDLYLVRLAPEATSVPPENSNEMVPMSFSLSAPYPNPFNPATVISYEVPVRGRVKVNIYNILGQEVATIAEGVVSPGSYSVVWEAGELPSGIYFVQMQAGEFVQTRKVVLLK